MKRAIFLLLLAALSLFPALPAAAQNQPGNLAISYQVRVKMGSGLKFEAALKEHMAWLRQQNETWTWEVWSKVRGPDLNEYVIRSAGHTLQDIDAHAAIAMANREHWINTVAQFTERVSGGMALYRGDISIPSPGNATPKLVMAYAYSYKMGDQEKFDYAARKITAAIKKTNWPVHFFWLQPINGVPGPVMVRVVPSENWAGFKPPSKDFRAMLVEAYGREEAESLLRMTGKLITGESSSAYMYRSDLSYKPAQ
jgi:hypothetical protein